MASTTSLSSMNQDEFTTYLNQKSTLRRRVLTVEHREGDVQETGAGPQLDGPATPHEMPSPENAVTEEPWVPNSVAFGAVRLKDLRGHSATVVCPVCGNQVMTDTKPKVGGVTILVGWAVCCLGAPCCFWIPCLIPALHDVKHSCSQCKSRIGKWDRLKNRVKLDPSVLDHTHPGPAENPGL